MLENVGVFGAFGRAWRLTRRQFWRTFGIALLTAVVTGVAGNVLWLPARHRRARCSGSRSTRRGRCSSSRGRQRAGHGRRLGLHAPFSAAVTRPAVPRPADAQGGLRRRADGPGRGHSPRDPAAARVVSPRRPSTPSPDEARCWLRRELLDPRTTRRTSSSSSELVQRPVRPRPPRSRLDPTARRCWPHC